MTWATDVEDRTVAAFAPLVRPDEGVAMAAYMKNLFPFLGISAPVRRVALKAAWADLPDPTDTDLARAARRLFRRPEREYHHAVCDLFARYVRPKRSTVRADFLFEHGAEFITTKSWWDSVDGLHSDLVGPLTTRGPELVGLMREWNATDNIWLVRSSIIHQLSRNETTDVALLFELCANRAADKEFFIAKGIGWALREYSYTDPKAVERFISKTPLQPLSVREGLKAINRKKARAGG
jgi:3-methyladenine DNA glycosylase AlkD